MSRNLPVPVPGSMPEERFYQGEQIGRYVLEERIGVGGMGEVWRATDTERTPVAIKFAHPHLANQAHFKEFARQEAATRLRHPNIVQTLDYFEVDNLPAIVFYYVEGPNLESEIYGQSATLETGTPLEIDRAIHIACDVLEALDFAHQKGYVHRDVKASNILLESSSGRALLSDFGLVMDITVRRMTRFGMMGGSVPYMSPEQIRDPRTVDLRSDLYSFGIVLYEMITGVLPFRVEPGETEEPDYLIKNKHRFSMVVPPSQLNPHASSALDRIVLKSLEKDKDQRYRSCADFAQALRSVTEEPPPRSRVIIPEPGFESAYHSEISTESNEPKVLVQAGTLKLTEAQVTTYLPWVLMVCSALIIVIALVVHFR
jgi:eukaryotic-like serine/threonine-protein kinase